MTVTTTSRGDRRLSWVLVAPAALLTGSLVIGGLAMSIALSFGLVPGPRPSVPGTAAYHYLLEDIGVRAGVILTVRTALIATGIAGVLGISLALSIRAAAASGSLIGRTTARILRGVLDLVLAVPHVVAAVGMLFLLAPSGVISRWVPGTDFPLLTQDRAGVGIVAELIWKESVFVALVVLIALDRLVSDLESDAAGLGAGRWQRLTHVTVPLVLPSALLASAVSFAYSVGTLEVPQLLGTSYPASLSRVAYDLFRSPDLADRPAALAVALLTGLIAVSGAAVLLGAARGSAGRLRRGA